MIIMDVNVTQLQEFLHGIYNLSFTLSITLCPDSEANLVRSSEDNWTDDDVITQSEYGIVTNTLHTVTGLFSFLFTRINVSSSQENEKQEIELECIPLLSLNLNQKISSYILLVVIFLLFCFLVWSILCTLKFLCQRGTSKSNGDENRKDETVESKTQENFIESEIPSDHSSNNLNENISNSPLRIHFPAKEKNLTRMVEKVRIESGQDKMDSIFDSTLSLFLKHLDSYLGLEVQKLIHESYSSTPSSPLGSVPNELSLQSPRVRRKWSRPQDINPSVLLNHMSEKNLRSWMLFEMICKRMNWSCSNCLIQNLDHERNRKNETLNVFLKFLNENCGTKLVEWNVSVFVVNYSLFLLEQMFNVEAVTDKFDKVLQFARFESTGSAANGTFVGNCNHFDVMFVIDFHKSTHLDVLHNKYCDEISPGHVVIELKDADGKNELQSKGCLHKGRVKDVFGSYLLCNQIENVVDGMIRKALNKLNTCHKYKMQRLPFRLNMNSTKSLELVIDTSLLNGIGLGVCSISIRFIPSICIESPEFALLPKMYAVPTWRSDHRKSWEEKEKRVGALTKLFLQGTCTRIPSNLYWNLSVSALETKVRESLEDRFDKSGVQNCYKECLMILKALFSSKSKHTLLNKGEISPYILSTVVNFLLMESSVASWEMSQLPNRVSDAVHFLRSSFENIWLPNFIIHNPHLNKKIQALNRLSPLLTGRQQNLLADIDTNAALKTVAFVDSRLKETGLSSVLNEEYSEEMWEYEFFLFG